MTLDKGAKDVSACTCIAGFYKHGNRSECFKCPTGGVCPGRDERPFSAVGYWGYPDVAFNTSILSAVTVWPCEGTFQNELCVVEHISAFLQCPFKQTCMGRLDCDPNSERYDFRCRQDHALQCRLGYSLPLCMICERNYFNFGTSCVPCPESESLRWAMSLGLIAVVLVLWILLNNYLADSSDSIDMALLFAQIGANIGMFNLQWSPSVNNLIAVFQIANFLVDTITPNCIFVWTYAHSFFLQLFLPFALIAWYSLHCGYIVFKSFHPRPKS